jgi:hypothetical protein
MRQAVIVDAVRTPIGRAHSEKGIKLKIFNGAVSCSTRSKGMTSPAWLP